MIDVETRPETSMPLRPIQYADEGLDRAVDHREDEDWLREQLASPATRMVPVARRGHPLRPGPPPEPLYLAPAGVQGASGDGPPILLGQHDGVAYFAIEAGEDAAALFPDVDEVEVTPLRNVVAELNSFDATVLAYAGALVHWQVMHRFCPACGHPSTPERAGHAHRCTNSECAREHFPRTDPAVITLVIDDDRCLLARRAIWPVNRRSTVAGFVEPGETLEQAVRREILEEVGVRVGNIRYRGSQPWPFPASLMLGFWAEAETRDITVDGEEIAEADWYTRDQVREAVDRGDLLLPPADSISRRLVEDWLDEP
jgi:NAD+ diphosphatase